MRYILSLALTNIVNVCSKMADGPTVVLEEKIDSSSMIVNTGNFQNGPYGMVLQPFVWICWIALACYFAV